MPSLQVITLGCSKNTVDTEHLLFQVQGSYDIVPEGEQRPVDVLLVNTCGFIGDAKEQSIQVILEAAARKKAGEVGRLLVFGCLQFFVKTGDTSALRTQVSSLQDILTTVQLSLTSLL